jgi:integrase
MNKKGRRSFGYIRKLPSGRFQASYVGPNGKRYFAPSSYRAIRDANQWLATRQVEIERDKWEEPQFSARNSARSAESPIESLETVFEDFLSSRLTRGALPLRENTKDLYRRLLRAVLSEFRYVPLTSITKQQVSDWYLRRVATSKVTTASKGYKLLKMILDWAVSQRYIEANPCDIAGAQSATTGKQVDSPEPEEVRKISNQMPDHLKFAVILGAYAGLRYGELTELRRKDLIFYLENGEEHFKVNIRRSVTYFNKAFTVGLPKSKWGVRVIEVNKNLLPELREHMSLHVREDKEALLFANSKGEWIRHDSFIRSWNRAIREAGLEGRNLVPHSLRHFGATQLVLAGATLPELKVWLGDSSTDAVSRYLHATNRNRSLANSMKFVD